MANELRSVVRELGGERALGRAMMSDRDLREAIREGFPHAVLEELMQAAGLTLKELADALDLSSRSLQRRRRGRLARFESDRLYRLARLLALARESLGDAARADGSSVRIALWVELRLSLRLTPSSAPARWKICWVALRMAASVDASLPRAARGICPCPIRRRGSLPVRRAMVKPRNPPCLCL